MAELLFWPALLAYGEAAVAFVGEARHPGVAGRFATWGVRIGWLVQTALLVVQASRSDGFPWTSWSGVLNLFVWLVVGAYLIWGCRARFRLLGLAVIPPAAALLALAYAGGGTRAAHGAAYGSVFLALHVGLVLAAFAGFTLAAALAALYLWQERRLKRRARGILRVRAPSLSALDELVARTIAVALPVLTLGIGVGIGRLVQSGGGFSAVVAVTLVTWAVYGGFLVLRYWAGWRGRRSASLALLALTLVVATLPIAHFS
ncbi:MAG TPA: cytochrome c biogenesis protein CcsA [Candidatus Limnocylindria bacterium]|nr:cytochrome c biogenesis protein CcsA [Candidatus Limnocylindria bacterium]